MAEERIKDLSTTAILPKSDDFLAQDGATAGTVKIPASLFVNPLTPRYAFPLSGSTEQDVNTGVLDADYGLVASFQTTSGSSSNNPTWKPYGSSRVFVVGAAQLGDLYFTSGFKVSNLSTSGDRFTTRCGLANDAGDPVADCIYFTYADDINSGKIQCVCRNNNSETTADSGVTVVAGTWYICIAIANAAGASVKFYVNGSLVATITTNIPTGTSRALMCRLRHSRSSDSAGESRVSYMLPPVVQYLRSS